MLSGTKQDERTGGAQAANASSATITIFIKSPLSPHGLYPSCGSQSGRAMGPCFGGALSLRSATLPSPGEGFIQADVAPHGAADPWF